MDPAKNYKPEDIAVIAKQLDFKSPDTWKKIWEMGLALWHIDFVEPYVDNLISVASLAPVESSIIIRI